MDRTAVGKSGFEMLLQLFGEVLHQHQISGGLAFPFIDYDAPYQRAPDTVYVRSAGSASISASRNGIGLHSFRENNRVWSVK